MSDNETTSISVASIFAALAKAQGEMKGAKKDATNPHFKQKYADLASIWDACRVALSENGLCVIQTTSQAGAVGVCVVTTMGHSSGEWVRGEMYVPVSKQDAQGFGSAITYARRYALAAIVGVAPEDDDGEAAVGTPRPGHGPIKAPAPQATPVDEMTLKASVIATAIKVATSPGALNELWADVIELSKAGMSVSLLTRLGELKDARKAELAGSVAA